jgi:hypothetical protein
MLRAEVCVAGESTEPEKFPIWLETSHGIDSDDKSADPEELDDLKQAYGLLEGRHDWSAGDALPEKRYLNSDKEFVARKALVRLLRNINNPLDSKLRRLLAALFDPETETPPYSSFDSVPMEQRVIFKGRHRGGGLTQNLRKLEIGSAFDALFRHPTEVLDELLKKIVGRYEIKEIPARGIIPMQYEIAREDALAAIAERYKITVRTVEAAVAHHRATTGK